MIEKNVVKLENNKEYYELKKDMIDNVVYLLLASVDDDNDIEIRKLIKDYNDNETYITKLDSEEELKKVLNYYKDLIK